MFSFIKTSFENVLYTLGTNREIHYLYGGNGLAAIYTRTNGKDTLFAAVTDRQNSLTAVMDVATGKVEKFAYKPWGMRRNPTDWSENVVKDYPARFSRGYCMHEHLPELGLINMGGRVYNARTNQFLSPDPYRQAPDSWLNCNRFGYCMGNPVMYTDPDGEYFGFDDVITMLIGGIVNSVSQCISGNVHNVGQFFSYFGVGAVAGEISLYASPVAGGMFLGGANAAVTGAFSPNGISGWDIIGGVTIGGVSAGAGSALSSAMAGPISSLTSSWENQVLSKAVTNIATSTGSGFVLGTAFSLLTGADWRTALGEGGKGAALGFGTGTLGSVAYSVSLYRNGFNPWTGDCVTCPDTELQPMNALAEPDNLGNKSNHAIERQIERGVSNTSIENALKYPLKIIEVKYDLSGRPSVKYIGEMSTVVVNPETGKVITVYPTNHKIRIKLNNDR